MKYITSSHEVNRSHIVIVSYGFNIEWITSYVLLHTHSYVLSQYSIFCLRQMRFQTKFGWSHPSHLSSARGYLCGPSEYPFWFAWQYLALGVWNLKILKSPSCQLSKEIACIANPQSGCTHRPRSTDRTSPQQLVADLHLFLSTLSIATQRTEKVLKEIIRGIVSRQHLKVPSSLYQPIQFLC